MDIARLATVARALVAEGKGILAADESSGTIKKRLDTIGVESTEANRRIYRGLLFTTPGVEQYISGVILFDETIRQRADDGTTFPELLAGRGMIPGIKVDKGTKPLALFAGEVITEGLDGLRERLIEYKQLGAQFAKWRAVIRIGTGIPTRYALSANARALARYAAICQELDIVPIVEPEVLMEGGHSIERCEEVTVATLQHVFFELFEAGCRPEGLLLKTNMVLPGQDAPQQAMAQEIATATIRAMQRAVPPAMPGIVFLSGGQTPEEATERLNAMNVLGKAPWELSFSYGRALQEPVLKAWRGENESILAAQRAFYQRARLNGLAREGRYTPDMEHQQAEWPATTVSA